jgi:hypothetical protein
MHYHTGQVKETYGYNVTTANENQLNFKVEKIRERK